MNIDNVIKNLNTQNDTHIVIGVSAGPDSMALLHSAITNLNKTIICAHINHNVRKESKNEQSLININTHIDDSYVDDENIKIEIHQMINEIDSYEIRLWNNKTSNGYYNYKVLIKN